MKVADILRLRETRRPADKVERSLRKHLLRLLGDREVAGFRTADVLEYRRTREAEGASPATVNRELRVLRAALNEAVDEGLLDAAPRVKWRVLPEAPKSRVLSRAEVSVLLGHLRGWHRDLTVLLLGTGARVREVLELPRRAILVDGDQVVLTVEDPKEGQPKVLVAVGEAAEAALRLASRGYERPFARAEGSTVDGDYLSIWRALRRVSGRYLEAPVTPHDLRRTYASTALRAGVPLEQVGQVLGHRSLETTRRYARIDAGVRQQVAGTVAGSLGLA